MSYIKWAYKDGILSHEDGSGCVIGQSVVIADELITRLIADFTESEESNTRLEAQIDTLARCLAWLQNNVDFAYTVENIEKAMGVKNDQHIPTQDEK